MVSSTGDFCRVYHLVQRGGGGLNEQGVCQSVVCSRMADSLHWNCPIKSAMSDPRDCHALHLTANKVHHVTLSFVLHRIVPNKPIFALKNELAIQPHFQNSHLTTYMMGFL